MFSCLHEKTMTNVCYAATGTRKTRESSTISADFECLIRASLVMDCESLKSGAVRGISRYRKDKVYCMKKIFRFRRLKTGRNLNRSTGGNIIMIMFLLMLGAFTALPFLFAIFQSLKGPDELFVFPPRFFVVNPTLDNYFEVGRITAMLWVPLSRYVFNSVLVTVIGTGGHVLLASMAAFPLAKYKFPGSKWIFAMIVLALLFSFEVTYLPSFVIISRLGLLDNLGALIIPAFSVPLGLFLMKQFMEQIPDEVIESARMDGANVFAIYVRLAMPLVKPAWLTLIIFSFQALWNRGGLEFIYSEQYKTLPTVLMQITATADITTMTPAEFARAGAAAAVAIMLMIPPIIVFVISQNKIIETMAHSGIKD